MSKPIAYTYMADTHCPPCAVARFGPEPGHEWPRDDARDGEGNPVGAIFPWDEWHPVKEDGEPVIGSFSLVCGTCGTVMDQCEHPDNEPTCTDACCV